MGDEPKFKVGDRVRVSVDACFPSVAGATGAVVAGRDRDGDYRVRADDGTEGWASEEDLSLATAPAVTGGVPQFVKDALVAAHNAANSASANAALHDFARRLGLRFSLVTITTVESI